MARSAKQQAALRKAQLASAAKRRGKGSLASHVRKYNQDGPPKLSNGKRIGEGLVDSVSVPKSGFTNKTERNKNLIARLDRAIAATPEHAKARPAKATSRNAYTVTNTSGQQVRTGHKMHAQAIKQGYYQW